MRNIGIRPAWAYQRVPSIQRKRLWELLNVEKTIEMSLTTSYAMWPELRFQAGIFHILTRVILRLLRFSKTKLRVTRNVKGGIIWKLRNG